LIRATAYRALRTPQHEIRQVRGLQTHLTWWGPAPAASDPPAILLHGWQDTGDTFQFMVDAFKQDRPAVALDWRGFGRSEVPQDGYWFPDYLADLDALVDQLSPTAPVRLVGHSMGGNLASLYAGLRPERVRCVVNLEGFGLPSSMPGEAPARMRKWLDQVKTAPPLKTYDSIEQLASIIGFRYPRFSPAQADFVSRAWSKLGDDGRVQLMGDPRHRRETPTLYHRADAQAIWHEIAAPMLLVLARQSEYLPRLGPDGSIEALHTAFPTSEIVFVEDAGHMLHIEKAEDVALLVENFLSTH
jgi:pimeloyl-ACP methyl ester carboxylesterase